MKIMVACELPESAMDELRRLGSEVVVETEPTTASLARSIDGVSILIVGQTPVSPDVIDRGTALQMIVCAGISGATIAVDEASAQGIFVTHCPDMDAVACAEMAIGLILALDRHIIDNAITLREGRWDRGRFLDARGLAGRTLGVLGSCPFRLALAERAQAFKMKVLTWMAEPNHDAASDCGIELCNWPRELARRSDVVVVHTPVGHGYDQAIDDDFLESIQENALLVHIGDVSLLDESTLVELVKSRNLKVALDVYQSEPAGPSGKIRSQLLKLPGVIGTHHISGATEQARQAVADEVVRIVSAFLVSGEVINAVNLCEHSPAMWQLVLRLRDQVGVMANILEAIRADGINAEEITSKVFRGAKAAWCTIALDERPSNDALKAIQAHGDVLHLELRAVM